MATYVISDIHGHYDEFMKMLRKIKFSDEDILYMLGDAIDKGKDSIKTLLYIMNHPNIKMCLGNHEYMMFNYLQAVDNNWEWDKRRNGNLWLRNNFGKDTYDEFLKLSKDKQQKVKEFIWNLPLFYPDVEVNGKKYYLVHSTAYYYDATKVVSMVDTGSEGYIIEPIVWDRNNYTVEGKTVVHGHTINYDGRIHFEEGIISIDCGAAANYCLGCLRLDDEKEFYVPLSDFNLVERYHNRSHKNVRR